jgi:hypothetical protein
MNQSARPVRNSKTPAGPNLWLAIGDETGTFDNPPSSKLHGAGLILARPAALAAALNENLNGQTIRQRMDKPIDGLETWLRAKGAEKSKELTKHHVREAWSYLTDKGITGHYPLDALHADPVLTDLLCAFRWLATHQDIISLGIHGNGKEVMTDFWKGSDPMAAIGAMYGTALALVRPFLGTAARIRMLPGRRSEETNSAPIWRAGQDVASPFPGTNRQTSSKTGGNRALLETMESEFWKTIAVMDDRESAQSTSSSRQRAFAGYMNKEALIMALEREDQEAANLIRGDDSRLNNLADLACSLMAASCDSSKRDLRIQFLNPVGPNVKFFSVKEILS